MITAAFCFDGVDDEGLIAAGKEFLCLFSGFEAWCAYGDDAQRLLGEVAERHHAPPPPHHANVDAEQADAIAKRGVALLAQAGIEAVARIFGGSDPGHAIAAASRPDYVLILAAGHREGSGPKSVGHVARFVIDHARGPVLVLRTVEKR